jgi:hypothetical protein
MVLPDPDPQFSSSPEKEKKFESNILDSKFEFFEILYVPFAIYLASLGPFH